ncbi:type VI secretion protein [Bordetella sp. H567]|uniref:type VI secretion system baseplate subunit TssK n=1 Tax=Bordetella sp. H567 TaxID=1697043 RepID=UPI00081C822F|nr:type VI secretion system baseplate subunit TssK [Bordetella sp. H567]AOB32503.1 type VI secretion protein [Bordetella sp. H567]
MDWNSKVVWSEGMLLQQQHLQQHDRYFHHLVESYWRARGRYGWGYTRLVIDEQQLGLGKVGLVACEGVMPDGTPFSLPADDGVPPSLDIPEDRRDAMVVLALPLRRLGVPDVAPDGRDDAEAHARYRRAECTVADSTASAGEGVLMEVGKLRLRLALADTVAQGYATLGVARVRERRPDHCVVLDMDYSPPSLACRAAPRLAGFIEELKGLLHQRGQTLSSRLAGAGSHGTAEIVDFLLLQLINRVEPLFDHFVASESLHPEVLYRELLQLSGELATFVRDAKRPGVPRPYRHDDLAATFTPLMDELRRALSLVSDPRAVSIALEPGKFGLHIGRVPDTGLLKSAEFVLEIAADMPAEALLTALPAQVKIGPVEKIHDLVTLQLPGIGLRPLSVAPRQLPFRAGRCYFALDMHDELWPQLATSAGIALHVAGDFPGLQIDLWAIRA